MTNGLGHRSKSTILVKNLETRTHDVDLGSLSATKYTWLNIVEREGKRRCLFQRFLMSISCSLL